MSFAAEFTISTAAFRCESVTGPSRSLDSMRPYPRMTEIALRTSWGALRKKSILLLCLRRRITSYNNFYEFGTGKNDPGAHAGRSRRRPWTVKIDGLCAKPADYTSRI